MKKFNMLCVFLLLILHQAFAQEEKTIFSGDYKNKPLKEVIGEIEANSKLKFFYSSELKDTFRVTTSFSNVSLRNAIDIVFDNLPITFSMQENRVTLFLDLKKDVSPPRFTIKGSVKDNYGRPVRKPVLVSITLYTTQVIRGAKKPVLEYRKQTTTDENGAYTIEKLKAGRQRIKFEADGYYKATEQVDVVDNSTLDVKLTGKSSTRSTENSKKGDLDQRVRILERIVTVDEGETSVKDLLGKMSDQGKFSFEYDSSVQMPSKKVALKSKSATVKELLDEIFSGSVIRYTEFNSRIILRIKNANPRQYTLSGNIKDVETGESLIGVFVTLKNTTYGSTSNQYGYYSLTVPEGDYELLCSYIGYQTTLEEVSLFGDRKVDIELSDDVHQLQEVVVIAEESTRQVSDIKMGMTTLGIKKIKSMPAFLGEADVIKSITLLPGVATVGEGTTGFNVRGGAIDQNLVILDEAPVYNTSHLFGFFSVFNPDIVKDVNLYKSGIPAKYGGRLSSVLDVTQKDGNSQKFGVSGGLGILGARLALEGPLMKDKSSFIIAARKSYIGELLESAGDLGNNSAGFYDVNTKFNFKINDRNKIYWSAYTGKDNFTLGEDELYLSYRNLTTTLRWNHLISDKVFSNFSAIYSNYKYTQGSTEKDFEFEGNTGIVTYNFKSDFTYYVNPKHTVDFGLNGLFYQFKGINVGANSETSPISDFTVHDDFALEPALYIQDEYTVNEKFKLSAGIRYSGYYLIAPGIVYKYRNDVSKDIKTITDTIQYKNGSVIKHYHGLEPRVDLKLNLTKNSVLQVSYDRSRQNIHLISNTVSATPLDIWKGSNTYVKPEIGNQFSIGYFRNFKENTIETSVQGYYKNIENVVEYKDGANLILNKALDADLLTGKGRAYGVEFSLNKNVGQFTGWLSYTYSRTERQVNGTFLNEKINKGKYYPSNYDFPNRITLVMAYKLSLRTTVSTNFTYNTGRPTTYPDGRYYYSGIVVPQYATRNQDRLPDYHRLDLALTIDGKAHKKWRGQWVLSVYNVYSRKNAYSIYLKKVKNTRDTESIRLSILGSAFPSLTYNFKF